MPLFANKEIQRQAAEALKDAGSPCGCRLMAGECDTCLPILAAWLKERNQ